MKKIIFMALLAFTASCQKPELKKSKIPIHDTEKPLPCVELDKKHFFGKWKYLTIQNTNDATPQPLDIGLFQMISVTFDSTKFVNYPSIALKWDDLGCSVIRNFNGTEDLKVTFPANDDWHMYLTGLTSGTIWYLEKQY